MQNKLVFVVVVNNEVIFNTLNYDAIVMTHQRVLDSTRGKKCVSGHKKILSMKPK